MSTVLALTSRRPVVETTRRSSVREAVETWRRAHAPHLSIATIERLIDALTATETTSSTRTKPSIDQIDDAVAELHTAARHLDDAETTLASLRRALRGE